MQDRFIIVPMPGDYAERIKKLRVRFDLTQKALADRLGVSNVTVNRWENEQAQPSPMAWNQLNLVEEDLAPATSSVEEAPQPAAPLLLDFSGSADAVRVLAEGERLSFGHLANAVFATEISRIDPLPHQRVAVYDHLLLQPRLRFLLADDAGAGKTIMAGLYIREMLSRRLIRRILVVPPAGLVGNWRKELANLFRLSFKIVSGSDAKNANPFVGREGDQVIVSVDTLSGERVFGRLCEPGVEPYDLVIFDEAHKLAADRGSDMRVRKTVRYRLAEAFAGVKGADDGYRLDWSAQHLLLLTATPHMGKDYPYYALWRLLEPDVLATPEAFAEFPVEERVRHFIRRTKEEMVKLDGSPLYPKRISDTQGYALSQGDVSEQALYDQTTEYLRFVYNRAKLLNREAARLAMSVFQRRLASSTWALLRSLERRLEKLDALIDEVQSGRITPDQLALMHRRLADESDPFEQRTADEESEADGREENEMAEERIVQGIVAASLADLLVERDVVRGLLDLARRVHDAGTDSKFERLAELLKADQFKDEKVIVFTEHRDTLQFLVRVLNGLGYTGQIAQIHGGMHYTVREDEVERFRKPVEEGGARLMVCTDAAGEGINLQFCWIMFNYDVPWNPARLEQRMGRIHRYGQKHDPVVIVNLVAPSTREGKVLKVLLDKLETIRKALKSDKVFDVIGRLFEGVSIKEYMELTISEDADEVARRLDGQLTPEQVEALSARERKLYGDGGDVARELPRLRCDMASDVYRRLVPGYVRQYVERAAPLLNLEIVGGAEGPFALQAKKQGALDPLLPELEKYPEAARDALSFVRPIDRDASIWLHPGEPLFEAFRALATQRLGAEGLRGAILVDPTADKPYYLHVARLTIVRRADPDLEDLAREDVLDCRVIGVRQSDGADLEVCPIEKLLLLRGAQGLPAVAQKMAVNAKAAVETARAFVLDGVARQSAMSRRDALLQSVPGREAFLQRGFDYREAELATARARLTEKARTGNRKALEALEETKRQQKLISGRRARALEVLRREPELIVPGPVEFVVHALVVPSSDRAEAQVLDRDTEQVAMNLAWAYEEASGAIVKDVHTPDLARLVGLPEHPGFDLLSIYPSGERRGIEVKGRSGKEGVEVEANEWARACNLRDGYWLYAVYDCATPHPELVRVQDPFGRLLAKEKGSWAIGYKQIVENRTEV